MKKKIVIILSIFTLLFLSSCGSKPEEETVEPEAPVEVETPVEETPVEEVTPEDITAEETPGKSEEKVPIDEISQDEVDALLAEANAARDKAVKAGAESRYPNELKEADDYFNSIKDNKVALKKEHDKIIEMYNSVTSKIEAENAKAALISDIEDARAKAIKSGVEEFLPEELKQLDDYVASLKEDDTKLMAEGSKVPGYYNLLIETSNDKISEKLIADTDAARARAINAGVEKEIPEALYELDAYVADLKKNKENWLIAGLNAPASYDALIVTMNEKKAEDKLLKSIEIARNKAIKAGAETEASAELKQLDEYFAALKDNKDNWKVEGNNVPGYYDSLTKFVNDKKIANNILVNIKSSRAKAVEVGAETKTADILKRIDEYTDLISDNSGSVKANGHKASNSYKSLVPYIGALEAKKIIDEENLASYAQTYYDRASAKMATMDESYKEIDEVPQTVISDATDARRDFRSVITIAYKDMAKSERDLAYAEKKNADKVRAGVTQKERYKSAVENFKKGDSLYSMQDAKNAVKYYQAAKEEFAALHSDVSEEMLAALAAIEAAKKNVAESSQYAEEADEMAPITSKNVEGIEDEDTVLLEADNYEDPNAAVIAVDDVVEVTEGIVEEDTEELVADEKYVDVVVEETEDSATKTENEEVEEAPIETAPETEAPAEAEETVPAVPEADSVDTEAAPADPLPETDVVEEEPAPVETVTEEDEVVVVPAEEATETVPEVEESSEDVVETPVITDEVVTDSTAATEEKNESLKDDFYNEVFAK